MHITRTYLAWGHDTSCIHDHELFMIINYISHWRVAIAISESRAVISTKPVFSKITAFERNCPGTNILNFLLYIAYSTPVICYFLTHFCHITFLFRCFTYLNWWTKTTVFRFVCFCTENKLHSKFKRRMSSCFIEMSS